MNASLYERIVGRNKTKIQQLREKKILLVSGLIAGGLLDESGLVEKNASVFADVDAGIR
jgi:hypothetical protein